MDDAQHQPPSLLSRLLQDPVKLRRRARVGAVVVALLSGIAGSGVLGSGALSASLTGLAWLLVPVVAVGIGMGDAFFLRHGVGDRRVAWTLLLGFVIAVSSCVILAVANASDSAWSVLSGTLYFLLVIGVVGVLSAGIAIAAGKAGGYLSRRIQSVDDTHW